MRALLIEDDIVFNALLTHLVKRMGPGWEVVTAATAARGFSLVEDPRQEFALAVVDMGLPDAPGADVVRRLRDLRPGLPVLVVSAESSEASVTTAIRAGARGYIHKTEPPAGIVHALEQVLGGQCPVSPSLTQFLIQNLREEAPQATTAVSLTPKETETLRLIARGLTYMQVGENMGVSLSTVQTHIRSLYRKLEARSQVQAVGRAREWGLL